MEIFPFLFQCNFILLRLSWAFRANFATSVTSRHQPCRGLLFSASSVPTTSIPQMNQQPHSTCRVLGRIHPIRMPGETEEEATFVGTMRVPTYGALDAPPLGSRTTTINHQPYISRDYRNILQQGPSFLLDNILSVETCSDLIATCESQLGFANFDAGKNNHGALQIVVTEETVAEISNLLRPFIDMDGIHELARELQEITQSSGASDIHENGQTSLLVNNAGPQTLTTPSSSPVDPLEFVGLNRRWRIYRYAPGGVETFAPHIDCSFPASGLSNDHEELVWDISNGIVESRLTILFYLNDDFIGGETNFYSPVEGQKEDHPTKRSASGTTTTWPMLASVRPKTGSCLLFPQCVGEAAKDYTLQHWPLHEGSPVQSGSPKYVVRSDVLFRKAQ